MTRAFFVAAKLAALASCFLFVATPNLVRAAEIKVLAGSALESVLGDLILKFEQSSGHKVMLDSDGAVGAMTNRIRKGEAVDVAIVSGPQIDLLEKEGKVIAGSRVDLAKVGIGLFIRKGTSKPDISSVEAFKRTLLAAKSIGYNDPAAGSASSIYLIGAFERLGIGAEMKAKTVVFQQRTERFAPVARGEVEIGFNQISEILVNPGIELAGPLPAAIQNYTLFSAGIVASSKQMDAATSLISFLASPDATAAMRAKGFE
jgi:molybdate transport system substrate-binding protein